MSDETTNADLECLQAWHSEGTPSDRRQLSRLLGNLELTADQWQEFGDLLREKWDDSSPPTQVILSELDTLRADNTRLRAALDQLWRAINQSSARDEIMNILEIEGEALEGRDS